MATFSGPRATSTSNLILSLDGRDKKSINFSIRRNPALSKWYCVASGYNLIFASDQPNVTFYKQNALTGTISVIATPIATPQRGTVTSEQGFYYFADGPAHFYVQAFNHVVVPLSRSGYEFMSYIDRYQPIVYYIHSPYADATVSYYEGGTGTSGTAITTITVTKGSMGTISSSSNLVTGFIKSNVPVIATRHGSGGPGDMWILNPMIVGEPVYNRILGSVATNQNTSPSIIGTYYIQDNTYPCMSHQQADGSGGDGANGQPLSWLSDTYFTGYGITYYSSLHPYDCTLYVEYWNGTTWVLYNTHVVTGASPTNPQAVVVGSTSGADPIIAGQTATSMWRFRGTNYFWLLVQDEDDDEETLQGYVKSQLMNSKTVTTEDTFSLFDASGYGNIASLYYYPTYNSTYGGFTFNGTTQYGEIQSAAAKGLAPAAVSMEAWVKHTNSGQGTSFVGGVGNTGNYGYWLGKNGSNITWSIGNGSVNARAEGAFANNTITHVCGTYDGANTRLYINGVLVSTITTATGPVSYASGVTDSYFIGQLTGLTGTRYWTGDIYTTKVYNRALTSTEVYQNYLGSKARFGF